MTDQPHASALLAEAGRALYGADWQSPLARRLGLNLRTVQRISAAAASGEPYPIAPGVLSEVEKHLAEHAAQCTDLRARIARLLA
jgi:hypothetical protein